MKKVSLLLLGLSLAFAFNVGVFDVSYGQNSPNADAVQNSTEFNIRWISDQRVTGVKKEAAHATYIPYSSREALTSDECYDAPWLDSNSDLVTSLNGTWKFRWVKGTKEGPGPSEFQAADLDDSEWDDIRVPMNWEMTGKYNLPTYNNTGYPFHNHPPYATEGYEEHGIVDHNATGFYRRTFDLPKEWSNKEVFVHFDGVYSCCVVWVNGKFCGYSQGSNTDAEFDITSAIQPGKNQLSVRVYRWCDGSYLEGQDMWRLSGIHRDVYLVAKPKTFIRDHYLTVADQSADELSYKLRFTPISTDIPTAKNDSGLDKFDFFYAGERPDHKMFIVKDGRVVWRYDDPEGRGEISDAILLSDGHILMAHQYGIREIVPDLNSEDGYSVVWKMETPNGYEIHSLQPIGTDKILYVQCGRPFEAVVMEIPSMKELKRIPLPFRDGGSHGQMRNMRLTKDGTLLLGSFEYNAAIEFDSNGKELRRWECPGAWGVEELENGNILVASNRGFVREFTRDGEKVWEFDWKKQGPPAFVKVDGGFRSNVSGQKAHRLPNGDTMITNWQNPWSRELSDPLVPAIQAIETTPDGDVVWKLSAWDAPADLGPSTTIQLLDEPVDRAKLRFGEFK